MKRLSLRGIQKADGTLTEFFFTRESDWDPERAVPLPEPEEESRPDEFVDDACPF